MMLVDHQIKLSEFEKISLLDSTKADTLYLKGYIQAK